MKHLKLFENKSQYDTYSQSIEAILPNVSYVAEDKLVYYNPFKSGDIDYSNEYLYFEALEDGMTVSFTKNATSGSLYYSLDKQEWNELTAETPVVNNGEKVYFKGDLVPASYDGIGTFTIDKNCNVGGNVMSLLFGDNFIGKTDFTGYDYAFYKLFDNCTAIKSAENLSLPATTLANECYSSMFYGCTSLTTAPELPATTLAKKCYNYMFSGCTNLTTAPELPATTLISNCYSSMFKGCTKLNYIKAMFTTTPSDSYTYNWVSGVSATGIFVKNANATWNATGVYGIPSGWTVQTA